MKKKENRERNEGYLMTDKQLRTELLRCEYCEDKPCKEGCPADCSPADFIMAAKNMTPADFRRAAALIMRDNPLGGVCGMVCPDRHCMAACSRKLFDKPINIPDLQAEIVQRGKEAGGIPEFTSSERNSNKVAVIGGGPAGYGAAALLAQKGYTVEIFESRDKAGGMCHLIPDYRLDREVLATDLEFAESLGGISVKKNSKVDDISVMKNDYDAVIVATGLWKPIFPGAENEDAAIDAVSYLSDPASFTLKGRVGVIGGGATALDCAVTAKRNGASGVEMFSLENISELPLSAREQAEILEYGIDVSGRTKVLSVMGESGNITGVKTIKVRLSGDEFSLSAISEIEGSEQVRNDIDHLIIAVGNRALTPSGEGEGVFFAGDCAEGPTTVVEAVAAGKNAALMADAFIMKTASPNIPRNTKSRVPLPGFVSEPVSLETDFFGRKIATPFLLSAAPPSDGYEQMKKAYEAGWTGGVLKTSFASGPIHIPGEYMHTFGDTTYGNCDNVSGHLLDRVCDEISRLVKEFPDRLTIGSTGGPVTGNDEADKAGWQANTKRLEDAGAMGIEYSLSCPQGGEGTEGDIVSQSPELTAKVIDWVMETSDPDVPKLFKLTAAVTSINAIMDAIKEVLDRYPNKKAGVTLANTFPVMGFQERDKKKWANGIVFGMSGEGVAPISYFTLARAVPVGVDISGNGGPMDYMQTANFLALGVKTVQYCTIVMKYGYGIIDELKNGVSWLMKSRGISSMNELIGIAQPDAITDFMDLSAEKKISSAIPELCMHCGNCTRCPYLAISLNEEKTPEIDPSKCIGCSICTKKCFSGALYMRERTPEEKAQLKED